MWLIAAFFATALLYASVGFGGGSTYNALLVLAGTDYRVLPAIALCCNIIVVGWGSLRFAREGITPWRKALPFFLLAPACAFLGGRTPVKETTFLTLLAISLAVSGILLLIDPRPTADDDHFEIPRSSTLRATDLGLSAALGYLAGLVGIGGGIFLAPWLHFSKWAGSRAIAATASLFILVNSVVGLAGQAMKLGGVGQLAGVFAYWPLALAVALGGLIGNQLGIKLIQPLRMRRITAVLILYAAGQLLWKLYGT
jgi:uncharacterized protein